MPNHIHGIIRIENQDPIDVPQHVYGFETIENSKRPRERRGRRSLPGLIKGFKSVTTRIFLRHYNSYELAALWQASYYDEVIRNEEHYTRVLDYIDQNPMRWADDKYFSH